MIIVNLVPEVACVILGHGVRGDEDRTGGGVANPILFALGWLTIAQRLLSLASIECPRRALASACRASRNRQPDDFAMRVEAWIRSVHLIFHAVPYFVHSIAAAIGVNDFRQGAIADIWLNAACLIGNDIP